VARFARRDAGIVALACLAWVLLARRSAGDGPSADLFGVVAGLLVGAAAYVLHEWGHLLAGLAAGGAFGMNANLRSPFAFRFDPDANSLRQFVVMSLGGFAVTAAAIALAWGLLPDGLLATRVARGAIAFLATLTFGLELPLLLLGLARGRVPREAAVPVESGSAGDRR
jgi:hypothetical protein